MNPVKVISLTRSVERRTQFAELNAHVDFEFFDAVEGSPVMSRLDSFPELFEPGLRYNAGAIGCAISHLTLWQEAAETDRERITCDRPVSRTPAATSRSRAIWSTSRG